MKKIARARYIDKVHERLESTSVYVSRRGLPSFVEIVFVSNLTAYLLQIPYEDVQNLVKYTNIINNSFLIELHENKLHVQFTSGTSFIPTVASLSVERNKLVQAITDCDARFETSSYKQSENWKEFQDMFVYGRSEDEETLMDMLEIYENGLHYFVNPRCDFIKDDQRTHFESTKNGLTETYIKNEKNDRLTLGFHDKEASFIFAAFLPLSHVRKVI